jgi:dipeptidyl aminopeptidase/acylaminoacyl peptidase
VSVFTDLSAYAAVPRVTGIRLSPDGTWLAVTVQAVTGEPPRYTTSIWRVPVAGGRPARLTRSAEGEGNPGFLPDGSLLFISARPAGPPLPAADQAEDASANPSAEDKTAEDKPAEDKTTGDKAAGDKNQPAVWLLPAGGGEARPVAAPPGGAAALVTARDVPAFALTAGFLPGSTSPAQDASRRQARADAGVSAILHESGLVRFWDHDLGPDRQRLLAVPAAAGVDAQDRLAVPLDLAPDVGGALLDQTFDLAPDGSAAACGWFIAASHDDLRCEIAVLAAAPDAAPARRTLLSAPDADFRDPRISPDGATVVAVREGHDTYEHPGDVTLVTVPLAGGEPRDLLAGFDRWPVAVAWAPDSSAVYFTADDQGRRPVFRADLAGGEVRRITADDGAYGSLCPAPDGTALYALRSAIDAAPAPVRISLPGGEVTPLASPAPALDLPGTLTEVQAAAEDGTSLRGWLVLPEGASAQAPAPLLLWVHGGPQSSWNDWSWRWNPWLMAARGYAVLLPDPALSTGYGQDMMQRGHGTWGANPYTDVMAMTDAVVKRPDIDDARTAMMGGSFGGYMANWIAGHTGRFRAIVSHAGLWALDQMLGTTDLPAWWYRAWGHPVHRPERYQASSPHLHVADIVTPMLVIHGDKDYRVPVGEALRLWSDLSSHGKTAKFLYFPDENHWILRPGDVPVWYETVLAFLAVHVHGEPWQRPSLL